MTLTLRDDQLRDHVVEPVLRHLGMHSQAAVRLVTGTALVESNLDFIEQIGGGPALGLWQMEPATHDDIRRNWLVRKPNVRQRVDDFAIAHLPLAGQLAGNLYYACAMCRIHYYRRPEPLPKADDIDGLGRYWKRWYNTAAGAGTVDKFVAAWRRFET